MISGGGAITGVVIVAAGRFTQLVGPLVALQLLPAAATLGVALELGEGEVAARSLSRLGIDIAMVLAAGAIYFTYKHLTVHGRRQVPR